MNAANRRTTLVLAAVAVAVAATLVAPIVSVAGAQAASPTRNTWEALAASGALIPTGAERSALKDAPMSTLQASYVMHSRFAITSMLGWARSRAIASVGAPKLDVFTFDVGTEARAPRWLSSDAVSFTPFAGFGAGSRSYRYRSLDVGATHNLAGYGSAGGELGVGRVHLRLEVRDYVSGSKALEGVGAPATRNDVVAMIGLRLSRHAE